MNEGTYNNVVRSNSPFSPMTPSTPNTYKPNVNRTKTRKWVEAKVQSYDGDDWGNEYEDDEYDEPESAPAPAPAAPTSRIAALRQQAAASAQQPRASSQPPTGVDSSNVSSPLDTRSSSGPPSLRVQTGVNPKVRPVESAPDSGFSRAGRASSSANVIRSPVEQQRRTSLGGHDSYASKQTLPSVEEQKSSYGTTAVDQTRTNQPRLSTSPKLPDLARLSGFGNDFFSPSGGYEPSSRLKGNHAPSALEGPKLEPNPNIIMPPLGSDSEPRKEDPINASQRMALSRPQLPGTWVSETVSAGSEHPTPTEKTLGSVGDAGVSPMNERHAAPADLEPTTAVKQLPTNSDSEATARDKVAQDLREGGFNNPTGKHDDVVASKVIAAGPGFHPTPQSLPPLKTENPLLPSTTATNNGSEATKAGDMALASSLRNSPSHSPTRQSAATAGPGFTPTAPLNPRRSVLAPADFTTPTIQERKSTMSTVDTASPEKESDKLREEIIKSLSASPTATPEASTILGSSHDGYDPAPGNLTRESTYLSGVYDDYLTPAAEEKSLMETGQLLKEGLKIGGQEPDETESAQKEDFPRIAPLSPRRSPDQETGKQKRRFSWEDGPPVVDKSVASAPRSPSSSSAGEKATTPQAESSLAAASSALQIQVDSSETMSHQISDVSSRAAGDLSIAGLESPSPISLVSRSPQAAGAEASRLSFADEKEKVLIQSSSNPSSVEQHPALADPIELTPTPSPAAQPSTTQLAPQTKIMAFRDILNLASIGQRIEKFDETRTQFYAMESGLSNWIAYMQSQPDHGGVPGGQSVQTPPGSQPSSQQPYYQQYLNASTPGAPPAQTGRVSSGNLQHVFTGQPMSTFASGNQVGAKSKELLQTAGAFGNKGIKSGMKLFNKGKNKLRGTGDKVFF
ncbi:hypothetical protein M426DRAFT_17472 [Hypoxylon sp. CI-4A]|nr:hypothetical protein M426DRAFT_17472 [Hypoxylon sp. CI-4A]